jgi:carboxypeptidase Taq
MMAAQQWATVEHENPNVSDNIREGNFSGINDWRRKNIWSKASTLSTPELMRAATGETLQAKYFTEYLQRCYLG